MDSCDPAVLANPARNPVGPADMSGAPAWERMRGEVAAYHGMLDAYARGDGAGSIDALLGLTGERLAATLKLINRRGIDPYVPWDAGRYALAVMLHTDAALRLARGDIYGNDSYDQLQAAADLLQLGARCAPGRFQALAPRWYVTLSRYLRDRNALAPAEALLDLGRRRFTDEAGILFESGLLAESLGTIYALSPLARQKRWVPGDSGSGALRAVVARRRAWLDDAVAWLRRASTLAPHDDAVLLHLGRVQALRFDDEEALRTLAAVLGRTTSADAGYLAAVFMGGLHDRQGRAAAAASAYREALEKIPGGHAARVGLAEALRQSGRLDEAREALGDLLAGRPPVTSEPLWWYILEPPGAADARLEALRAEVRR